jgi:hypothetical protein
MVHLAKTLMQNCRMICNDETERLWKWPWYILWPYPTGIYWGKSQTPQLQELASGLKSEFRVSQISHQCYPLNCDDLWTVIRPQLTFGLQYLWTYKLIQQLQCEEYWQNQYFLHKYCITANYQHQFYRNYTCYISHIGVQFTNYLIMLYRLQMWHAAKRNVKTDL